MYGHPDLRGEWARAHRSALRRALLRRVVRVFLGVTVCLALVVGAGHGWWSEGMSANGTTAERRDAEYLKQHADELLRRVHRREHLGVMGQPVPAALDDARMIELLDSIVARAGRLMSRYRQQIGATEGT